jgi:hypothetical protein
MGNVTYEAEIFVKVVRSKSIGEILFAEARDDFMLPLVRTQ